MHLTTPQLVFTCFFLFGLLNNVLYVVILSAAIDLVGASTPKAIVLLANITPALLIKGSAPFYIDRFPYATRIWVLLLLSSLGMLIISLTPTGAIFFKVSGIGLGSLSSGLGELTFLQLTHFFPRKFAIGGFSSGTGGAGLLGSFVFLLMTNILSLPVRAVLFGFAIVPWAFILVFFVALPHPEMKYDLIGDPSEILLIDTDFDNSIGTRTPTNSYEPGFSKWCRLKLHCEETLQKIKPLFLRYMLPLGSVYLSEYIINQGVSPTLLYPLDTLPKWLFSTYRDLYVVYGFVYQVGVFLLRTSNLFGIRIHNLYLMAILQFVNLLLLLVQSISDKPFGSIYVLMLVILYEGLLGGLSYVNTFLSVSENVAPEMREFSMGCTSMSDSVGVVIAGCINWWLEPKLCSLQVARGREWCRSG